MSRPPALRTALTEMVGVSHPIVQTGMGWVSGARLVSATAQAGGLGILASATMSLEELHTAIRKVAARTDRPFGVNLRADATDALERAQMIIDEGVKVASFALAPSAELIDTLKAAGVIVISSVGAPRHAEKAANLGVDMVMVQGGEGGGHTGAIGTTVLLPAVLDAVDIPVIAAGGFSDGRGLASALAFGACGVGMGTRFLLTTDNHVPDNVKQQYLSSDLGGTVVTDRIDGMPHRVLHSDFVDSVIAEHRSAAALGAIRRAVAFRRMSGSTWPAFLREGWAMKKTSGRSVSQMMLAANTPVLLRAGLVEGDADAGVLASGQVAGAIVDLPSCEVLIDRMVDDAVRIIDELHSQRLKP